MKKIDEMDYEEIAELGDDALDLLVKIECAENGIPLEPVPPEQEFFDIPKDIQGHCVKIDNLWFKNKESAVKLMALINDCREDLFTEHYDWRVGYEFKWLQRMESIPTIETKLFTRKEFIDEKEELLIKRRTLKEQYENQKKLHDSSKEKKRKIADRIYGFFYEAKKRKNDLIKYKTIYGSYLSLANNDQAMAKGFFDKAYKESIEECVYNKLFKGEENV